MSLQVRAHYDSHSFTLGIGVTWYRIKRRVIAVTIGPFLFVLIWGA